MAKREDERTGAYQDSPEEQRLSQMGFFNLKPAEREENRGRSVAFPYVTGVSENLRRIFNHHRIPVHLKPSNTLRQKQVHPEDKTQKLDRQHGLHSSV